MIPKNSNAQRLRSQGQIVQEPRTKLIERTLELWQPRSSKALSEEDARQIAENVTGFFRILMEWGAAEQHTTGPITNNKRQTNCLMAKRILE